MFSSPAFPVSLYGLGLFNCFYFLPSSDLPSGLAGDMWLLPFSPVLGTSPALSPVSEWLSLFVVIPFGLVWLLSAYSHIPEAFPLFVAVFTYPDSLSPLLVIICSAYFHCVGTKGLLSLFSISWGAAAFGVSLALERPELYSNYSLLCWAFT